MTEHDLLRLEHTRDGVRIGTYTATVRGVPFCASWVIAGDNWDHFHEQCAKKDILWYVNDFFFAGCGGPKHNFGKPILEPQEKAKCAECGVEKRFGLAWKAE